jgi:rfaE bifunctional protein kinase chain/domain
MNTNFIEAINKFDKCKVLVIGDIMLDVYEYCLTSESRTLTSEKPGKLAYKSQKSINVLGGAGNVAMNLSSLNANAILCGVIGNDGNCQTVYDLIEYNKITHIIIKDKSRPTTTKSRLYIDDEYILRRDNESSEKISKHISHELLKQIEQLLPEIDAVILSDYNKGMFTEYNSQNIIAYCKDKNVPVIVDFKPINKDLFIGADIMAPNENEAKELYPEFQNEPLVYAVNHIHEILKCNSTIITLGANGICGQSNGKFNGRCDYTFNCPGIEVEAKDAVGCGDTVRAVLALGIACGLDLREAACLANYAGAIVVQKPLTASITKQELIDFVNNIKLICY